MEKIFDQEYLETVKNAGVDIHLVLRIVKQIACKCSQLERKINDIKESNNSN